MCSACLPAHPPQADHHVFPITLLPIYFQDSTGVLLRQGELIDQLTAELETQGKGLRGKLERKVIDTFDQIHNYLQKMRTNTLEEVRKYASDWEKEYELLTQRLFQIKYNPEWQAETELELLISREDRQGIADFHSNMLDWVFDMDEYKRKWETLSHFRCCSYLRSSIPYEPSCIAVANGQTHLFSLPSLEQLSVPEDLAWLEGSLLLLPSTEWFFCDFKVCNIISYDFTSLQKICELKENRQLAGLVHYRNCVYLFGGHSNMSVSNTVECVDISKKCTRLLAGVLPLSFFGSQPCRQGHMVYFGPVLTSKKGYKYNLLTERLEFAPFSYENSGHSEALAFPENEVVVLSDSGVCTFHSKGQECYALSEATKIVYMSNTAPVRLQGNWYLTAHNRGSTVLIVMSESTREPQQVRELEQPDLMQRLMRGQVSLDSFLSKRS